MSTEIIVKCDMVDNCLNPVTHIGEKGYVYCSAHAPDRKGWERVRKMQPWELKIVRNGGRLTTYKRGPKPREVTQ